MKPQSEIFVSFFSAAFGQVALIGSKNKVQRLLFGDSNFEQIYQRLSTALKKNSQKVSPIDSLIESDWYPECREAIVQYAAGEAIDLSVFDVAFDSNTTFQSRVLHATHAIPFGETVTYASLALKAGSPRAARAVGSVMSKNKIPLLIPCHRVVAAGGRLGGFSAPDGTNTKRRLLEMEKAGVCNFTR